MIPVPKIRAAISNLIRFLEKDNFQGWEPYDVWNDRWAMLMKPRPVGAAITQLFRVTPLLLHRHWKKKKFYAKSVALFARAFLVLYEISKDSSYRNRAIFFLNWLEQNRSSATRHFSLGAHYQVNMKTYRAAANTPSPFITALGIEAFISAYEILGDDHFLELASSGICFFLEELPQITITSGQSYFVYHPNSMRFVPNLPAVIGGTMAHFYSITRDKTILTTIQNNLRHVIHWQRDDGAWFYSPTARYSDNFHTGFILEALAKFQYYVRDQQFDSSFWKGLAYYERHFFDPTGRPIHKKLYGLPSNIDSLLTRIDLRDCAQGLILFSFLLQHYPYQSHTPFNLLNWSLDHFRARAGYFYYQQLPIYKIKGPFISLQAWMLYGLCKMLSVMKPATIDHEQNTHAQSNG